MKNEIIAFGIWMGKMSWEEDINLSQWTWIERKRPDFDLDCIVIMFDLNESNSDYVPILAESLVVVWLPVDHSVVEDPQALVSGPDDLIVVRWPEMVFLDMLMWVVEHIVEECWPYRPEDSHDDADWCAFEDGF
jgi:hypothetical protein